MNAGHEVSKYVESKFKDLLTGLDQYKKKHYREALDIAFKRMDEILLSS
jgi:hypothetical protein